MSDEPETIAESIQEIAVGGTQSVSVDGVNTTFTDISKLIEADKYLGAKTQARSSFPLRMNKISPPGAA